MENFSNLNQFLINPSDIQVNPFSVGINFFMCVLMSFLLRFVYLKRSFSLTGKSHIASILPILSLIVFLVIIIVKSSLALSLGLVGALSIVRFRTPIKEPEELVYLFLSIGIGLGYGAGRTLTTTFITFLILIIIYLWLSNRKSANTNDYNLVINWKNQNINYQNILKEVEIHCKSINLVRIDSANEENNLVILVSPNDSSFIKIITDNLKKLDKEINITFFESKTNW